MSSFVLGLSVLPFLWNVMRSYRYGEPAGADDLWDFGNLREEGHRTALQRGRQPAGLGELAAAGTRPEHQGETDDPRGR